MLEYSTAVLQCRGGGPVAGPMLIQRPCGRGFPYEHNIRTNGLQEISCAVAVDLIDC
jgi:hypothetical protein